MKMRGPPIASLVLSTALLSLIDISSALDTASLVSQRGRPLAREAALLEGVHLRHVPAGESHSHSHGSHEDDKVDVWPALIMSTLAGASTVLGATVILFMPEGGPPPSAMAFSFSLAAGVMMAISVEMLMPHDAAGNPSFSWTTSFIFCCGAVCCALLCKLADCFKPTTADNVDAEKVDGKAGPNQEKQYRLAALLFLALTLHNFPEGFAVAVSAMSGLSMGLTMCIAIAFHNIPEGIALAVAVYGSTKSYGQAFFWTAVSGLAEPLGALVATLLIQAYLTSTPNLLVNLLTAVAGVMCYVALAELLPEAISTQCWPSIASGLVAGVLIMVVTHWVIDAASDAGQLKAAF